MIQNISDTTIYIQTGAVAAVVDDCFKVYPGNFFPLEVNGHPLTDEIRAIHGGSGNKKVEIITIA